MRIEVIGEFLHKRVRALQDKCKVAQDKGLFDLYYVFDNELKDAQIASALVDKLLIQMNHLNFPKIREEIVQQVSAQLPFLCFRKRVNREVEDVLKRNLTEWIPPRNV